MTLYEILRAPPTATRSELKSYYVKMAKLSHPDARVGKNSDANASGHSVPEFSDVAAAWEVLSDSKKRKRYDRKLRADRWSKTAQSFANEQLDKAVPAVSEMLEKVAVPFLRRTTATTVAVGQAVAQGIANTNKEDNDSKKKRDVVADTLINAVEAGQKAGRAIDSIELTEKSLELEER